MEPKIVLVEEVTGLPLAQNFGNGIVAIRVIPTESNGRPLGKANLVDIGDDPIFYEGYKSGSEYQICKIDTTTDVISRTWGTGAWADRKTTIIYQ